MTDAAVLDASAMMAFLRRVPGHDRVESVLDRALISAVNMAEVVAKAVDRGGTLEAIDASLAQLPLRVIPFVPEDALISGSLRAATRNKGLSLGDRCCLALGVKSGLPVLTTARIWRERDVGVTVEVIR